MVEKYHERLAAPKAHALSPRSLEICRQYGIDTNLLRRKGTSRGEARWVNFCTTLDNERIGRLPYERMDTAVLEDTPEMIHNIPQPAFETHLADLLSNSAYTSIHRGLAFVACHQDADGVTSILEERNTGRKREVHSRYLAGCDGAKSAVRSNLRVECDGETSVETMMTIHFKADITGVLKDKVGMLHWCTDPAVSGFIIAYDPRGDMVLISNFNVSTEWKKSPDAHELTNFKDRKGPCRFVDDRERSSSVSGGDRARHTNRSSQLPPLDSVKKGCQTVSHWPRISVCILKYSRVHMKYSH